MRKYLSAARVELEARPARRLAFAFTLFLIAFETYVVRVNHSQEFINLFDSGNGFFLLISLALVAGSTYLVYRFIHASLHSGWAWRTVYFLLFSISLAVEYSYQKALGRFSQAFDVEFAAATTFEQKSASLAMYFGFAALAPTAVYLVLLIFVNGRHRRGVREFLTISGLTILGLAAASVMSVSRFPTVSTIAFCRTGVEFALFGPVVQGQWGSYFTGVKLKRDAIQLPDLPAGHLPDNNIVFVIDESVRGDHLSVNGYGRVTTPFLDDLSKRNLIHNWGIAAAASTGSHTSYNTIITGLTPNDFPDLTQRRLHTSSTIFQHAKAMGYTTWFFDGQMPLFWGGIRDDRKSLDHWFDVTAVSDPGAPGAWGTDNEIARRVNKIVSSSKGNFIFVFKHGSHVPYDANFPPEHTVWQPSYANADLLDIPGPDQLDSVVNAYDNSILYNVNSFFENLIDDYERMPNETVIVYTSDHGQTLFANGRASHNGNTREEALVPLFIIGDLGAGIDTAYKASHQNLYPTLLDLMKYPTEMREQRFGFSLLKAKAGDSRPRHFNPSYGAMVAFD